MQFFVCYWLVNSMYEPFAGRGLGLWVVTITGVPTSSLNSSRVDTCFLFLQWICSAFLSFVTFCTCPTFSCMDLTILTGFTLQIFLFSRPVTTTFRFITGGERVWVDSWSVILLFVLGLFLFWRTTAFPFLLAVNQIPSLLSVSPSLPLIKLSATPMLLGAGGILRGEGRF